MENMKQNIVWFMTLIYKYKKKSNTNYWNGFGNFMLFTVGYLVTFPG